MFVLVGFQNIYMHHKNNSERSLNSFMEKMILDTKYTTKYWTANFNYVQIQEISQATTKPYVFTNVIFNEIPQYLIVVVKFQLFPTALSNNY